MAKKGSEVTLKTIAIRKQSAISHLKDIMYNSLPSQRGMTDPFSEILSGQDRLCSNFPRVADFSYPSLGHSPGGGSLQSG